MNNIKQPYQFQNPLKLTNSLLVLLYIGVALSAIGILDSLISYNLYSSAQYIEISDEEAESLTTVGKVCEFLKNK